MTPESSFPSRPGPDARSQVETPGLLLFIVGLAGVAVDLLWTVGSLLGFGLSSLSALLNLGELDQALGVLDSGLGVLSALVGLAVSAFMAYGATQMRALSSYPLAVAASVLALVPWSCCCCFTFPVGVWCLVVLLREDVKAAFPKGQ